MWLEQLRRIKAETIALDDAVAAFAAAKTIRAEYEARQLDVPTWIEELMRDLNHVIKSATADRIAARKSEIRAQLSGLETHAEKRRRLTAELDALDKG
jgi:hypothetical protein